MERDKVTKSKDSRDEPPQVQKRCDDAKVMLEWRVTKRKDSRSCWGVTKKKRKRRRVTKRVHAGVENHKE